MPLVYTLQAIGGTYLQLACYLSFILSLSIFKSIHFTFACNWNFISYHLIDAEDITYVVLVHYSEITLTFAPYSVL